MDLIHQGNAVDLKLEVGHVSPTLTLTLPNELIGEILIYSDIKKVLAFEMVCKYFTNGVCLDYLTSLSFHPVPVPDRLVIQDQWGALFTERMMAHHRSLERMELRFDPKNTIFHPLLNLISKCRYLKIYGLNAEGELNPYLIKIDSNRVESLDLEGFFLWNGDQNLFRRSEGWPKLKFLKIRIDPKIKFRDVLARLSDFLDNSGSLEYLYLTHKYSPYDAVGECAVDKELLLDFFKHVAERNQSTIKRIAYDDSRYQQSRGVLELLGVDYADPNLDWRHIDQQCRSRIGLPLRSVFHPSNQDPWHCVMSARRRIQLEKFESVFDACYGQELSYDALKAVIELPFKRVMKDISLDPSDVMFSKLSNWISQSERLIGPLYVQFMTHLQNTCSGRPDEALIPLIAPFLAYWRRHPQEFDRALSVSGFHREGTIKTIIKTDENLHNGVWTLNWPSAMFSSRNCLSSLEGPPTLPFTILTKYGLGNDPHAAQVVYSCVRRSIEVPGTSGWIDFLIAFLVKVGEESRGAVLASDIPEYDNGDERVVPALVSNPALLAAVLVAILPTRDSVAPLILFFWERKYIRQLASAISSVPGAFAEEDVDDILSPIWFEALKSCKTRSKLTATLSDIKSSFSTPPKFIQTFLESYSTPTGKKLINSSPPPFQSALTLKNVFEVVKQVFS